MCTAGQILSAAGGQHKNIDLVVGDADASRLEQMRHCQAAGTPKVLQPIGPAQPQRQVNVFAFVQQLDPKAAERLEARHIAPQQAGYRTKQRNRGFRCSRNPL